MFFIIIKFRPNKVPSKNIVNFFDWVQGAELIELKQCNTNEDPVRPELDNVFRRSYGRKIYGVKYQKKNSCRNVFCLHQ